MKTAEYTTGRSGQIILNKGTSDTMGGISLSLIVFEEESSHISGDSRFENDDFRKIGLNNVHAL